MMHNKVDPAYPPANVPEGPAPAYCAQPGSSGVVPPAQAYAGQPAPAYSGQPGSSGVVPPAQVYHGQSMPGQPMQAFSTTHAVTTQPNVVVVTQGQPAAAPRPADYMIFSCLTFWCCNWLFGAIAILFSFLSSSAADSGDMDRARMYGRVALGLNFAGVAITVLIVIIVPVVIITTAASRAADAIDDDCTYDECDGDCCGYGESCCYGDYCC